MLERMSTEQLAIACVYRLPSEMYRSQVRKQAVGCQTICHFTKDARKGVKDGNSFPIEPICELRDSLAPQVVGVEGGTLQQATENMQVRRGEAQCVQQRQTIPRSDAQRLRIGVGKEEEVAMRLNDALRLAGRPRGVINIGRRLARNRAGKLGLPARKIATSNPLAVPAASRNARPR